MSEPVHRLAVVAPELAEHLQLAEASSLRSAAVAAASCAVASAGITDPNVHHALDLARRGSLDGALRSQLRDLAEQLDERYWSLQKAYEDGSASEADYMKAFSDARAVSSVGFALDPDPLTAALEATYEAHAAAADGAEVLEAAERALRPENA
jgi:hypothetical protein